MLCRIAVRSALSASFMRRLPVVATLCGVTFLCSSVCAQPIDCSGILRVPYCTSYLGGNTASNGMNIPYGNPSHNDYGGGISGVSSCGGQVTARLKLTYPVMQNPPPPPAQINITIISHASAGAEGSPNSPIVATADNGLGDAGISGPPIHGGFGGAPCRANTACDGKVSSGMLSFTINSGASQTLTANNGTVVVTGNTSDLTVTLTPTASLSGAQITNGGTWVDVKIIAHKMQLDITGPGAVPNKLYSGTNAPSINFTASTDGNYLQSMQCIFKSGSEESVSGYPDAANFPSEAPGQVNFPKVMTRARTISKWDTTHFPDGTNLLLVLRATFAFSGGSTVSVEKYVGVRIYNKYSIRIVDEFENGQVITRDDGSTVRKFGMVIGPDVKAAFTQMKHGEAGYSITFAPKDMIGIKMTGGGYSEIGDVHEATAFQISAHGFTNAFQPDKNNQGIFDPNQTVDHNGVSQAMAARQGVPPQAWIVFLSSCSGATIAHPPIATGFKITASATNQAFCGFDQIGYIKAMQKAALTFWQSMAAGKNIQQIQTNIQSVYTTTWNADKDDPDLTQDPVKRAAMANAQLRVYGDTASKIHGLYGDADLAWYKLLTGI